MVEAYAVWKAVVLGRKLSFHNVIFEADALVVYMHYAMKHNHGVINNENLIYDSNLILDSL